MYASAKLRSSLVDIEAQISSVQSQLARLQANRANILEKLGGVTYPVLTLPSEISAEIFVQYTDSWYPTQCCSPMVLASVCSLWREVALSTPRLWTHLDHGSKSDDRRTGEELLRMWLPRAGALPVDIRIRLPDSDELEYAEIFRILAEHSAQLRVDNAAAVSEMDTSRNNVTGLELISVLDLFVADGINFPTGCLGPFPSLTKLFFSTSYDEICIPSSLEAPQLQEVSFRDCQFPADSDWQSSLPWNQLTVLRSFGQDIPAWLHILSHTPNLELLEFACDEELEVTIPTPPVVLPHLRTLILGDQTSHQIVPFLDLFALRKFHLGTVIGLCGDIMEDLMERSACNLIDMYLSVEDLEDMGALRRCLQVSPTVRSLEINCRDIVDDGDTLEELLGLMRGIPRGSPLLLPALSSLAISACKTQVHLSCLVDMLAARTGNEESARLVSFRLSFTERNHEQCCADPNGIEDHRKVAGLLAKLREMRSGGLKVDIESSVDWFSDEINAKMIEGICGEL
ncbi:hypothetical protein FB45DRAFT_1035408 [Roridomyces roridus]|uniref:F-box domain-containing protein n=1 Tax=Roridomyces roridus TaxID=1738132 RepID=A0AAD7BAI5_9AGAR|nr:hypothetical protein FB45DRAFT_1035408 [Roridomyces roridus]